MARAIARVRGHARSHTYCASLEHGATWEQLFCSNFKRWRDPCGSGLVSRKGRNAAPGLMRNSWNCWGCFAALSRHKAAHRYSDNLESNAVPVGAGLPAMRPGRQIT